MKKTLAIIGSYMIIVFAVFAGISFFYNKVPLLLSDAVVSYKFFRALYYYLFNFPAIIISGFIVGCSIQWKKGSGDSLIKFSHAMLMRYRNVIFMALGIVFIITMNQEVFLPAIRDRQSRAKDAPSSLERDIKLSEYYLLNDNPSLAFQYAFYAKEISPKNAEVQEIFKKAKDALDIKNSLDTYPIDKKETHSDESINRIETPVQDQDAGYSVLELLNKANAEVENNNWVNAHYWASLAVKACSGTDVNRDTALNMANYAWNKISNPIEDNYESRQKLYKTKVEGYTSLYNGDNLKAYYILNTLASELTEKDNDVERYLAIAKERVLTQYFFIDEASKFDNVSVQSDIHFSLKDKDGSLKVFYIKSVMEDLSSGGAIKYIEGMEIVNFDDKGNFLYTVKVPFAKAVSVSTSVFDDNTRYAMGIDKKWKSIPLIMMTGVDRETESIVSVPTYEYEVSEIPYDVLDSHNLGITYNYRIEDDGTFSDVSSSDAIFENIRSDDGKVTHDEYGILMLSMNFDDIGVLNQATKTPDDMDIVSLVDFMSKADNYGYSSKVYMQDFVYRVTYPLYMLILIVFAASSAWNYRLRDEKQLFHLSWTLVLPFLNLFVAVVYDMMIYVSKILCYVLVGSLGSLAIAAAFLVYLVIFIMMSCHFMSRTSV